MSIWHVEMELDNGRMVACDIHPNDTIEPRKIHFNDVRLRVPGDEKCRIKEIWICLGGERLGPIPLKITGHGVRGGEEVYLTHVAISVDELIDQNNLTEMMR